MRKPPARTDCSHSFDHPPNPSRRRLLKTGAAGVTAALAAGATVSARDRQAQASSPASQGPPPLVPSTAPAATGVIDPAALTAETWCEAWTWRPEEWPGQSLDLNVVERNEPTTAPSPGQVFPGQFSFGGISPAP